MAKKKKKPSIVKAGGGKSKASGSSLSIGIIAAVVIAVVAIGGVMGWALTRDGYEGGDSKVELPDFVSESTAPKGATEAYLFAVNNQDVLKYIPCYCGCGTYDGHT